MAQRYVASMCKPRTAEMVAGIKSIGIISSSHLKSLFRIWYRMFSFCLEEKLRIHCAVQIHSSVLARYTTLLWCLIRHLYRALAGAPGSTSPGNYLVQGSGQRWGLCQAMWWSHGIHAGLLAHTLVMHFSVSYHSPVSPGTSDAEMLDVSPAWWQRIHLHLCVPGHSSNNSKSHSPAFASACHEVLFWSLCLTSPCCFYPCFCVSQV